MAGVRINELPKFLTKDPYGETHSITSNDPLNPNEPLVSLLVLKGVASYLLSMKPRASEDEYELIPHIEITSKVPL